LVIAANQRAHLRKTFFAQNEHLHSTLPDYKAGQDKSKA